MVDLKLVIIGGGVAGAVASGFFKYLSPQVFEATNSDPLENHNAIMRFESNAIPMILGVPATSVKVTKNIYYQGNVYANPEIRFSNMYSKKVIDKLSKRSIDNLQTEQRFILTKKIKINNINYNHKLVGKDRNNLIFMHKEQFIKIPYDVCISTIPMPRLLEMDVFNLNMLNYTATNIYTAKYNLCTKIDNSLCQTIYFPDNDLGVYRASIVNGEMLIESVSRIKHREVEIVLESFGLVDSDIEFVSSNSNKLGKIYTEKDIERRKIIMQLTDEFNIYSFGRYAIWKSIRADDLISDLHKIKNMLEVSKIESKYNRKK